MIQNNASWKKRVRNVLNGKWKGLCENLQHSGLLFLVVLEQVNFKSHWAKVMVFVVYQGRLKRAW